MIHGAGTDMLVNGSIIFLLESETNDIVDAARLIALRRLATVRADAHNTFKAKADAKDTKMALGQECYTSWHGNVAGHVSQSPPFARGGCWRAARAPARKDLQAVADAHAGLA
jgi:hypothetical protein